MNWKLILIAVLLAGCSTPKFLENRVTCTVDKTEAHFLSKWGMFSIGAAIANGDREVICQGAQK